MTEAPFPWFGGKRKVAKEVWDRFGNVNNYVEPFFGSGAVLLGRPSKSGIETINDKDGFVSNFWRAVQHDPEQTANYADWPVNENDLHARHSYLVGERDALTAKLEGDANYYDVKIAGWWVWGICCWIGGGFCSGKGPWVVDDNRQLVHLSGAQGVNRKLVYLSGAQGVNRQLVYLSGAQGVNRKRVHLRSAGGGVGVHRPNIEIIEWFESLSERLKDVRVCCGDWLRVLGPSPTFKLGMTGVFLDPPYDDTKRESNLYIVDDGLLSVKVREWAIEAGKNPLMRVALCGYEDEHIMPDDWDVYQWQAVGGYGVQGNQTGRENRDKERIWFSPACINLQGRLF